MKLSEKWKCACFINRTVDRMKWNRQNLPIFIAVCPSLLSLLFAVFKLNFSFRISIWRTFWGIVFWTRILRCVSKCLDPRKQKFGSCATIVWILCDHSWDPYGNLLQFMATFGNWWQLLATDGNFCQLMATFGSLWQLMAAFVNFGNTWQLLAR